MSAGSGSSQQYLKGKLWQGVAGQNSHPLAVRLQHAWAVERLTPEGENQATARPSGLQQQEELRTLLRAMAKWISVLGPLECPETVAVSKNQRMGGMSEQPMSHGSFAAFKTKTPGDTQKNLYEVIQRKCVPQGLAGSNWLSGLLHSQIFLFKVLTILLNIG